MQSYFLHNKGHLTLFWHVFLYLEHMQLQGIISNQPTYSTGLPDYLPLKVTYVKNIFHEMHCHFLHFPGCIFGTMCNIRCFSTVQLPGQKWALSIITLAQRVAFYIMIFQTASRANAYLWLYVKTHSDMQNVGKKAASSTSLKANTFLLKGKLLSSFYG